jgi:hypothetical protein
MHGKRLRPVMEDYLQSNPNESARENPNNRPPPMRSVNNPMQTTQNNSIPNDTQKQRFFNPNQNKVQPLQNIQQNQFNQQKQQKFIQEYKDETNRFDGDNQLKSQRSTHLHENHAQINKGNIHDIYGEPHLHRTSQSHSKFNFF